MTIRERKSVIPMPTWDPALEWYARAVAEMRKRPATDPTSWSYQAAMHGFNATLPAWQNVGPVPSPGDQREYWNQCQHGSWYFLPWHRMYLAYFEEIVASVISKLGGPKDWALPFWNYSETGDLKARALPPAFTADQAPFSPGNNPLKMPGRVLGTPGHEYLAERDVSLAALNERYFVADAHGGNPGFGGPETGFSHGGGQHGALERLPHDVVHVAVGGVMGDPRTAALDPIFWLHHANIDRLWQVWLNRDANHANPISKSWLSMSFVFHAANGGPANLVVSQVQDTKKVLTGYTYEGVPSTGAAIATQARAAAPAGGILTAIAPPELLGATSTAHVLSSSQHRLSVGIQPSRAPLRAHFSAAPASAASVPSTVDAYLNFENITGTGVAPIYDVYLNLPAGADPTAYEDHYAGALPMFGVAAASVADEHQSGSGAHYVLPITDLLNQLRTQPGWQDSQLSVTLVPRSGLAEDATVTIGRISLYAQEVKR